MPSSSKGTGTVPPSCWLRLGSFTALSQQAQFHEVLDTALVIVDVR